MPFSPKSSQETTMRKTFEPQITFGTVPMSNIKFDIFCRHELVPILMALQQLYFNKPVLNEILVPQLSGLIFLKHIKFNQLK
jgi:hypothetical protein